MELVACSCKGSCDSMRCSCRKQDLVCGSSCKCRKGVCENCPTHQHDEADESDNEYEPVDDTITPTAEDQEENELSENLLPDNWMNQLVKVDAIL